MQDEIIRARQVYQQQMKLLFFINFKKKQTDNTKKIKPGSLLSGQIDKVLNVGDRNITSDSKVRLFLSILGNFNFKHL